MDISVFSFFWVIGVSIGTLMTGLYLVTRFSSQTNDTARQLMSEATDTVSFIYDDTVLIDATEKAYDLLRSSQIRSDDWTSVFALLSRSFPNLTDSLMDLAELGKIELTSVDKTQTMTAEWWNGLAKLTLHNDESAETGIVDSYAVQAIETELMQLRRIANTNPHPTWQTDESDTIVWANDAYMNHAVQASGGPQNLVWPLPHIFGHASPSCMDSAILTQRKSLEHAGEAGEKWFDITSCKSANGIFFYAIPADEIVKTEATLSSFTQTLTKTFAQLKQGLAIFDRDRNLMMFNPALVKLTNVPAEKLCKRPSLWDFLDSLRELRMIPEPKDYNSWKKEISELESAAETDSYCKVWQLPTGQTYRVTGRPHPGGAIALLFENISEEISLSRRFNAHLEQTQAILDSIDEAIAVFSGSGVLIQYNEAYQVLWGSDPDQTLIEFTAKDAISEWRLKTNPTPIWGDLTDFIYNKTERSDWDGRVVTSNGDTLYCRVSPLFGGATLVGFSRPNVVEEQALIPANQPARA